LKSLVACLSANCPDNAEQTFPSLAPKALNVEKRMAIEPNVLLAERGMAIGEGL
jgi:hypothetical protein